MLNCALMGRAKRRQNPGATEKIRRECSSRTNFQGHYTGEAGRTGWFEHPHHPENRGRQDQRPCDNSHEDSKSTGLRMGEAGLVRRVGLFALEGPERASRLNYMARSRRQCSAPCCPPPLPSGSAAQICDHSVHLKNSREFIWRNFLHGVNVSCIRWKLAWTYQSRFGRRRQSR